MAAAAAPSLVLVDMGAPLEECVRRLQSQLLWVQSLAAQAPSAPTTTSLLEQYRGTTDTKHEAAAHRADDSLTVLRRRVAQKLRRLSEEQHTQLCLARTALDEADMAVILPANTEAVHPPSTVPVPPPQQQQQHHSASPDEDDDLFSWVTAPAAPTPSAPPKPPAPAPPSAAQLSAQTESILQRMASELADVVEQRYRYGGQLEEAHQQLLRLQRHTESLLRVPAHTNVETGAERGVVGANLEAVLAYRPSHTIDSAAECEVWRSAWQRALNSASPSSTSVPSFNVGDKVELVDMAVLAGVNADRLAKLRQRCALVQKKYDSTVERLNRRLAQAALQLEELERRSNRG